MCGDYELVYPFITYKEEEQIKEKAALLKQQGSQNRSIKYLIGFQAPKSLKDKLAEKD